MRSSGGSTDLRGGGLARLVRRRWLVRSGAWAAAAVAWAALLFFGLGAPPSASSAALLLTGLAVLASMLWLWRTFAALGADAGNAAREPGGSLARMELLREKGAMLLAIKELEFDRAMGKISETDYQDLVARYRGRAIELMKRLDEEPVPPRQRIEREIERRLLEPGPPSGHRAEERMPEGAERGNRGHGAGPRCQSCGTTNDDDAIFCKRCGARLGGGEP